MSGVPSAFQGFGNLGGGFFAVAVTHRRQGGGVVLALGNGTQDTHAGRSGDVGNGQVQMHIHLHEHVVTPVWCSQAANSRKSVVKTPKVRTGSAAAAGETATTCASLPTSMPAA